MAGDLIIEVVVDAESLDGHVVGFGAAAAALAAPVEHDRVAHLDRPHDDLDQAGDRGDALLGGVAEVRLRAHPQLELAVLEDEVVQHVGRWARRGPVAADACCPVRGDFITDEELGVPVLLGRVIPGLLEPRPWSSC